MPDVPPGLEPIFYSKVVASGGESAWLPYAGKALFENVIPFDEKQGKVLLAWKKTGFGKNKYNPFAGPIMSPLRIEEGVKRDLEDQSGLKATSVSKLGKIIVVLEGNPIALDIDVYRATKWRGEESENDEIRPEWFAVSSSSESSSKLPRIPFAEMFSDNRYWVPLLASGKHFIGRCDFGSTKDREDVGKLLRYWFATV